MSPQLAVDGNTRFVVKHPSTVVIQPQHHHRYLRRTTHDPEVMSPHSSIRLSLFSAEVPNIPTLLLGVWTQTFNFRCRGLILSSYPCPDVLHLGAYPQLISTPQKSLFSHTQTESSRSPFLQRKPVPRNIGNSCMDAGVCALLPDHPSPDRPDKHRVPTDSGGPVKAVQPTRL